MSITLHDRRRLARSVALTAMPALLTGASEVCAELTLKGHPVSGTGRITANHRPDDPRTWWLDHAHPVAFSLAGHPGVVVASDGLRDRLTDRGVSAVLAHEYASLRALRCPRSPCCPALSAVERCNRLGAAGGGGCRRAGLVVAAAATPADDDRHQERSHREHR